MMKNSLNVLFFAISPFTGLTLLVGSQEGHIACENLTPAIHKGSL